MSNDYSSAQFWDKRYKSNDVVFDWYVQYPELRYSLIHLYPFPKSSSILMIGCGNSNLSEQLYDNGYTNITNIDISPVVIQQMNKQMEQKNKHMKWLIMDATNTTFSEGEFDVVMDKGTLDALICGTDLSLSDKLLREMGRVVKKTGQILIITHSGPEGRKRVFRDGLVFEKYDYHFSKLYLSSPNILINLMKANKMKMKGKTEKEILTKTMLEYSFVEMKKKRLVTEKYQIVWSQFNVKKQNQMGDGKQQEPKEKIEERKQEEVKSQIKEDKSQQININEPKQEQVKQTKQSSYLVIQPKQNQSKVVFKKSDELNPKQPFCFLYCITSKLYTDFLQKLNIPQLNSLIPIQSIHNLTHNQSLSTITINNTLQPYILIQTTHTNSVLAAIKYLQIQKFSLPKIIINPTKDIQQSLKKQNKLINFKYEVNDVANRSSMLMSMRSQLNFELVLPNSNPLGLGIQELNITQQILKQVTRITEKNISFNITPDQYQKLSQLAKSGSQSIQSLISSLWKPQVIISSFSLSTTTITIKGKICLPPIVSQSKYSTLETTFQGFKIQSFDQGYFYDKLDNKLIKAVSPICRSYADITIQKLWMSYYEKEFKTGLKDVDGIFILSDKVAAYVVTSIIQMFGEVK